MKNGVPENWFAPFLSVKAGANWFLTCPNCGITWVVSVEKPSVVVTIALVNHARRCLKKKKKS